MGTNNTQPQSIRHLIWSGIKFILKYAAASAATLIVTFFVSFGAATIASLVNGDALLNANTLAGMLFGAFLISLYWVAAFPLLLAFGFPVWLLVVLAARAIGWPLTSAATIACVTSWITAFSIFISLAEDYAIKPWGLTHVSVVAVIMLVGGAIAFRFFRHREPRLTASDHHPTT